jgi:hypothetical protein
MYRGEMMHIIISIYCATIDLAVATTEPPIDPSFGATVRPLYVQKLSLDRPSVRIEWTPNPNETIYTSRTDDSSSSSASKKKKKTSFDL